MRLLFEVHFLPRTTFKKKYMFLITKRCPEHQRHQGKQNLIVNQNLNPFLWTFWYVISDPLSVSQLYVHSIEPFWYAITDSLSVSPMHSLDFVFTQLIFFYCLLFVHPINLVFICITDTFFLLSKVKIICNLHHDQLRYVFHVSQRMRCAVSNLSFILSTGICLYWLTISLRNA